MDLLGIAPQSRNLLEEFLGKRYLVAVGRIPVRIAIGARIRELTQDFKGAISSQPATVGLRMSVHTPKFFSFLLSCYPVYASGSRAALCANIVIGHLPAPQTGRTAGLADS